MKKKLINFIKTSKRTISRESTIEYALGLNGKFSNNKIYSNNPEFVTELKMLGKTGGLIVYLFCYLNINLVEVPF